MSFDKQNKRGNYNNRSYQPAKSKSEHHGPNLCGCLKAAFEYCGVMRIESKDEIESMIDLALSGYLRWIDRLDSQEVPKQREPSKAEPETAELRKAREMGAYFKGIDGTPEQLALLRKHCEIRGIAWYDHLAEIKGDPAKAEITASQVIDELRPALVDERDDPAFSMSGSEARSAYYSIAKEFEWPDFALAGPVCSTAWALWLPEVSGKPRRVTDAARQLSEEDWRNILRGAWRVKNAGDTEPPAFRNWKARQAEGQEETGA